MPRLQTIERPLQVKADGQPRFAGRSPAYTSKPLLVDEEAADKVWEARDSGSISDGEAAILWFGLATFLLR
jgi:hypothetical protein